LITEDLTNSWKLNEQITLILIIIVILLALFGILIKPSRIIYKKLKSRFWKENVEKLKEEVILHSEECFLNKIETMYPIYNVYPL
jgi:hypothetical protein